MKWEIPKEINIIHNIILHSYPLPTSFDRPSLGSERSERERMRDGPSHSSFIHCTVPSLRSVSPSVRPVATLGCRWWSEGRSTEPQPIPSGETRSAHMARYGLSLGVNLLGHNGNSQDGRMKVLICPHPTEEGSLPARCAHGHSLLLPIVSRRRPGRERGEWGGPFPSSLPSDPLHSHRFPPIINPVNRRWTIGWRNKTINPLQSFPFGLRSVPSLLPQGILALGWHLPQIL